MTRILLIISCMVIVFLNQVAAAQETQKWSDKQIEELSKKFFLYSTTDGKESLVLTTQPDDDWYQKAFADSCDDTIVQLRKPETALSIPGTPLILVFLQCPIARDFQYDSVVAFFDRNNLNVPVCCSRSALMADSGYYYYGSIQSLEAREAKKGEFHVVVTLSGGDGGDVWSSLAFLHVDMNCKVMVLSKLYSGYSVVDCDKECVGEEMKYRFVDNKTVQVTTKNFIFTDELREKIIRTSRKKYRLEELQRNPKLRIFPRGSYVGAPDADGWTPLNWAAKGGRAETARELLDKDVEVDPKDRYGRTPLIWGAEKGHREVVRLLVDRGADINAKDRDGWTSLMAASQEGRIDVVKILLEKGADIDARDNDSHTPLMAAAYSGHAPVVKLLIEKGADVNSKDNSGRTALMIASENGHTEIVEVLKAHGAKE